MRIRTLEAELGVRLFERTNRRVRLTPAGERILGEARITLRAAEATQRAARRARDGETGVLRLGFVASAAFLRLPELLRALRAGTPAAELAPEPFLAVLPSAVPGATAIPLRSEDQSPLPTTLVWHAQRTGPLVERLVAAAAALTISR